MSTQDYNVVVAYTIDGAIKMMEYTHAIDPLTTDGMIFGPIMSEARGRVIKLHAWDTEKITDFGVSWRKV